MSTNLINHTACAIKLRHLTNMDRVEMANMAREIVANMAEVTIECIVDDYTGPIDVAEIQQSFEMTQEAALDVLRDQVEIWMERMAIEIRNRKVIFKTVTVGGDGIEDIAVDIE